MRISIIGLSLSSSWGNGHATTYRSLIKGLRQRGHDVAFFEREEPWYAANRDLDATEGLCFYGSADELLHERLETLAASDLVVIGSYVRETSKLVRALERRGAPALLAFYDIDTPVTIAGLSEDRCEYLDRELLPRFDLYLSFSGGSVLDELRALGARRPVAFHCSVDPDVHAPVDVRETLDLGYLGTYSADRQAPLEELLLAPASAWPAGRFAVAGAQYPDTAAWPGNVEHVEHLPPREHAAFFCGQRFTLNLTRADMRRMGHSPSVRLFEAACCATPIISDDWPGLGAFFAPDEEVFIAASRDDVLARIRDIGEEERRAVAAAARERVLAGHTGERRAAELEEYIDAYY